MNTTLRVWRLLEKNVVLSLNVDKSVYVMCNIQVTYTIMIIFKLFYLEMVSFKLISDSEVPPGSKKNQLYVTWIFINKLC